MIPLSHLSDSETMPGLLQKIDNAISNTAPWQKPLILLFEDGDKYNSVLDVITDKYRHAFIISEPKHMTFVTKDNQTECLLNGKTVDAHKTEIDLYLYLEGTPLLDIEALNYCIGLFQYENKPVICMICTTGKDTRIDNFPAWLSDGLEIVKYDDSKIEDYFSLSLESMQFTVEDEVNEPSTSPSRDNDLCVPEGEIELMNARLKKEMFAEITSALECHITRKYCCEQYELPVYLGIDKDTYYPKIATLAELHEDRYDIHDIQEYEQCYCTNGNPENFEFKLEDSRSIQRLVDKYCLTDEELSDPWTGLKTHLVMTRRIMVAPAFEDYIPPKEMSCNLELDLPKVSTKLYFAGLGRNAHLHVPTAIWQFERLGIEFIDIETLEDKGKEIIEEITREYGDGYPHRLFIRYDSLKGFLICDCFEITTLNRAKALSSYYVYAANHFADPDESFYTKEK